MIKQRRVAPEYSFRFTAAEISKTYGSADNAFAHGDYLNVAQLASSDSELRGCGLILGGLNEQGLAILDKIGELSGLARLCRAFALWSLGRLDEAKSALANFEDNDFKAAANDFQQLLERENINVFLTGAIMSVFPEHYSKTFMAPVYKYGAITVKYVASQLEKNAYDYDPADPLDEFIDSLSDSERPDILFSLSPQWLLAKNFHKVDIPKIIWSHDSDAFQYRNVDNFAIYDVAICNCSQEHFELSRGTPGLFCAANMLLHPLATPFPEAQQDRKKKFDLIFTGSAMAPFHSEKPRFLFNMAELAQDYTVQVVEGHMPENEYFNLISHSKFLPVINRYAGMPSPRWRDALANGAFLFYPEGTFYGEIAPGCFPYRTETMVDDIRAHLTAFSSGQDPAYDLSKVVPEVNARFSVHRQSREKSFERLLKYALFFGLVWPREPSLVSKKQRRLVWLTPAVDCGLFGVANVRNQISNMAASIDEEDLRDDIGYANAAHLYAQMVFMFYEDPKVGEWSAIVDHYLAHGLSIYPNSLLLHFNAAHWSFFRPEADIAAAAANFHKLIGRFDTLTFSTEGADVAYAYTLHDNDAVFPCYEYADVATSEMVLRSTPQLHPSKKIEYGTRQIIRSACYGYIGWANIKANNCEASLDYLERAICIYPLGLPVLRLYFDAMLNEFAEDSASANRRRQNATKLADAFFAIVNINPSALLTDVFGVVAILANNNERSAAKELLAAWYQLANIVHKLGDRGDRQSEKWYDILWVHRKLLPERLNLRIAAALRSDEESVELTQLEMRVLSAARRSKITRFKFSDDDIVGAMRLSRRPGRQPINVKIILRALILLYGTPPNIRKIYMRKAWHSVRRGKFNELMFKVHQWSLYSKWSKGKGLNPRQK